MCFYKPTIYIIEYISWTIKYVIRNICLEDWSVLRLLRNRVQIIQVQWTEHIVFGNKRLSSKGYSQWLMSHTHNIAVSFICWSVSRQDVQHESFRFRSPNYALCCWSDAKKQIHFVTAIRHSYTKIGISALLSNILKNMFPKPAYQDWQQLINKLTA